MTQKISKITNNLKLSFYKIKKIYILIILSCDSIKYNTI